MFGAALLAGISFTMSIFISNLSFADAEVTVSAKVAVLTASLIATAPGLVVLFSTKKLEED